MARVLVVDDEPAFLELTRAWLERSGDMQIDTVTSPVQGLRMLTETRYDVIVSDYEMPEMDGIAFLKEIRRQGMAIPFIIFSGRGREEVIIDALNNGADFYLRKGGVPSAQFAELRNMILQAGARRQAEAEVQLAGDMYRSIFEHTGAATFIIEDDMTVSLVNSGFTDLTGYRQEEVEGRLPWTVFIAEKDQERLRGYHHARRRDPDSAPRTYEVRVVDRHGRQKDVYMTAGMIPGTDRSVASMIDISDRRRFEEDLRAAHEQMTAAFEEAKASQETLAEQCCEMEDYQATLQGIIDFLPDPTFVLDRTKTVTIWNRAMEELTGITKSRIIGRGPGAILGKVSGVRSPLLAGRVLASGGESLARGGESLARGGESLAREIYIPPSDDREETYLWGKASALYDAQGRLSGAIESLRDVTEQKRMKAQFQHRVNLERVVSSISARFVALGHSNLDDALNETIQTLGSFLGVDRSYIFQLSGDRATADTIYEWCAEGIEPQIAHLQAVPISSFSWGMGRIVAGKAICIPSVADMPPEAAVEREFFQGHGILSVLLVPIATAGETLGVMGFETNARERAWSRDDITLLTVVGNQLASLLIRTRAHKQLSESEERFRTLIERSHDCYIRVNMVSSTIEYVSPSWERLTGYAVKECRGGRRFIERLVHPDDQEVLSAMHQEPDSDRLYAFRVLRKDHGYAWVEVCTIPVYGDDGHLVAIDYAIHDIDAWKQAEAALIKANEKLSLMNSIVRHDILNQVTVVLGHITLLQDRPLDPDITEALDKQRAAIDIIQSQIEFTRDYQDLGVRAPRWFFIEPLITSAVRALRPGGIQIITNLEGISVYADPLLSSVFYNLLENAMRHGKTVTEVRVTAVPEDGGARIIWEDNGVGVPHENKERIFKRGFGSHTGFGLFLIREILSITGITIRETGTPGRGVRFEIAVPEGDVRFE